MQKFEVSSQRVVEATPTRNASTYPITTQHHTPYNVGTEVTARLLAGDAPDTIHISIVPVAPLDPDDMTRTPKPQALRPEPVEGVQP